MPGDPPTTPTAPSAPVPILVVNCGSSSLKFALLDAITETEITHGIAERLGSADAQLLLSQSNRTETLPLPGADHATALHAIADRLGTDFRPAAIGHRVVHGGEFFRDAARINDTVLNRIEQCIPLAPLHNPANALGIRTTLARFPGVPQVAVFDTAFHQTLPPAAYHYAIPFELYERHAIRRYGFHGTSHQFVAQRAAELLDRPLPDLQLLTAHLGNGCSACAIRGGHSLDTTMGLTPLEGLMMGTRSGDVDPNLHQFLAENADLDLPAITNLLNRESGLLGVSGLSNDLRTLTQAAADGHTRAALAIEIFAYRLAKSLLALTASLARLDAIVFTGGIGENSPLVRTKTCAHLAILGVHLDPALNARHGRNTDGRISNPSTSPLLLVIPTNEELLIARTTAHLLANPPTPKP